MRRTTCLCLCRAAEPCGLLPWLRLRAPLAPYSSIWTGSVQSSASFRAESDGHAKRCLVGEGGIEAQSAGALPLSSRPRGASPSTHKTLRRSQIPTRPIGPSQWTPHSQSHRERHSVPDRDLGPHTPFPEQRAQVARATAAWGFPLLQTPVGGCAAPPPPPAVQAKAGHLDSSERADSLLFCRSCRAVGGGRAARPSRPSRPRYTWAPPAPAAAVRVAAKPSCPSTPPVEAQHRGRPPHAYNALPAARQSAALGHSPPGAVSRQRGAGATRGVDRVPSTAAATLTATLSAMASRTDVAVTTEADTFARRRRRRCCNPTAVAVSPQPHPRGVFHRQRPSSPPQPPLPPPARSITEVLHKSSELLAEGSKSLTRSQILSHHIRSVGYEKGFVYSGFVGNIREKWSHRGPIFVLLPQQLDELNIAHHVSTRFSALAHLYFCHRGRPPCTQCWPLRTVNSEG